MKIKYKSFQNKPLISIGIPTYKRPKYLKELLINISKYNYNNLEIIISENEPSCIESEYIALEFTNLNIKYYRQSENIGIFGNFTFVLEQSSGDFFQWNADDDIYDVNFVSHAVSLLCSNFEAVSYLGRTEIYGIHGERQTIDQWNNSSPVSQYGWFRMAGSILRINYLIPSPFKKDNKRYNKSNYYIYGIHRFEQLRDSWFDLIKMITNERDIVTAMAAKGRLLSDTETIYTRKLLEEHYLDPSITDGLLKIIRFNYRGLNDYERYKLRRLNPIVAYKITRNISKIIKMSNNFLIYFISFIYIFLITYLRNIFLSFYEILSNIKKLFLSLLRII